MLFKKIKIDDPYWASLIFSIGSIPGHLASTFLITKMGRRHLFSLIMLLGAIFLFYFAFDLWREG